MATEEILMAGVRAGGDRQDLHESIRVHSQAAAAEVKQNALPNDLISRLQQDRAFAGIDLAGTLDAKKYIGRAPQQVDAFIAEQIEEVRQKYKQDLGGDSEALRV